jgi:integrase
MAVVRLTQKLVDAQRYESKTTFLRDEKTPGRILAVNKSSKTWKVQADLWHRRKLVKTVRHTMGSTDDLSLDQARARAHEVRALIKTGVDPNAPATPVERGAVANWTLGQLWDAYEAELLRRNRSPRTVRDFRGYLERHLSDWRDLRLHEITNSMCADRFNYLTDNVGPVAANHVIGALRTAWNRSAAGRSDHTDPVPLQPNPTASVVKHTVAARKQVVLPDELSAWWAMTEVLPNPLRRCMHRFGLLSGLRPGNLMALKRDWIDLPNRAVHLPAEVMKRREEFSLPLSQPMVELIEEAQQIGEIIYSGSSWLFPTRSTKCGTVATSVAREKSMPGWTGHPLRRTHKTMALIAGVSDLKSALLLHHKIGSIADVYTSPTAMHEDLVAQQERVSALIIQQADVSSFQSNHADFGHYDA